MIPHPPSHPLQAQPPAEGVRLFLGELGYQSSTPPEGGQSPGGGEGQQSVSAPLPRSGLAAHTAGGGKASGKVGGGKGGGGKGGGGKGGGGTGGGKGGGPKPTQAGSMLLRNYDLDEASSQPYQEQIRDALSKNAVRVIDLFREWDDNAFPDKASLHSAVTWYYFDADAATAEYGAIADWCVSRVTDMSGLFAWGWGGIGNFNEDISGWDTSRVTDMNHMFFVCANPARANPARVHTPPCAQTPPVQTPPVCTPRPVRKPRPCKPRPCAHLAPVHAACTRPPAACNPHATRPAPQRPAYDPRQNTNFNQPLHWDTSNVTIMHSMFNVRCAPRPVPPSICAVSPSPLHAARTH